MLSQTIKPASARGHTRPGARGRAQEFDFRRPSKLNRDHLRNLQIIHETFSGQFATLLSSNLRTVCVFSVESVQELSYDEYVREIPVPTHISILSLDPLPGVGLWQLPIPAAMAIIELLLGGSGTGSTPAPQRPLTEIESSLIRMITDGCLRELTYAFESVAQLQPSVIGTESNPQFAQLASPSEMVVVVNFRLHIGDVAETTATMCYPYSTLQPLLSNMERHAGARTEDVETARAIKEQLAGRLTEVDVDVAVAFDPVVLRSHDLLELDVGDVVMLGHPSDRLLNAAVDGVPLFTVRPARHGKRVAAQVVTPLRPLDREHP